MASFSEMEYGKCSCGGHFKNREVEIRTTVFGRAIELNGVPQGVCPVCNSSVYKAQVLECIESFIKAESIRQSH
jgi:YgiT-type zinc finger domain-containing protein